VRCQTCQGKGFREVSKRCRYDGERVNWLLVHQPCEDCHAGQQSCCEGTDRDKGGMNVNQALDV
jgi:hypothetical protein